MENIGVYVVIILLIVVLATVSSNIVIVPQAGSYVIERLGAYRTTWQTGLHIKIPFFEKISRRISIKEQVIDFAPQPVITKDNVTMQIDTVVYFQITDAKLYAYGVENPISAIENLTATTLRNIIGDLELDQTLTSRDLINTKMRAILDDATDPWGIKVNRVELKNIIPPREIQDAMEKQMKAERERRESILVAEGKKQSSILVAEGEKESTILKAEADKHATIINAEAQKASMILSAEADQEAVIIRAEAERVAKIKTAQGEAESISLVEKARAESFTAINEACPNEATLRIKALDALQSVADGKSTKIIIPSEIQNLAGLVTSITETAKNQ